MFACNKAGCATVVLTLCEQPFASDTVTVYVPAQSAVAVDVVCPVGFQLYVYPGDPPEALTIATPLQFPKQESGPLLAESTIALGCKILTDETDEHPFVSSVITE